MIPTLHVLPHTQLMLRRVNTDTAPSQGPMWALANLDDRARCLWEVIIGTSELRTLLECFADGHTTASIDKVQVGVYADSASEEMVRTWANRNLACHGSEIGVPLDALPTQEAFLGGATGRGL